MDRDRLMGARRRSGVRAIQVAGALISVTSALDLAWLLVYLRRDAALSNGLLGTAFVMEAAASAAFAAGMFALASGLVAARIQGPNGAQVISASSTARLHVAGVSAAIAAGGSALAGALFALSPAPVVQRGLKEALPYIAPALVVWFIAVMSLCLSAGAYFSFVRRVRMLLPSDGECAQDPMAGWALITVIAALFGGVSVLPGMDGGLLFMGLFGFAIRPAVGAFIGILAAVQARGLVLTAAPLEVVAPPPPPACPACGREVSSGDRACMWCGARW